MKKQIALLAVLFIFMTLPVFTQESETPKPAEENKMSFSVGVEYMSNYLWRGGYWYEDGAIFPSVTFGIGGLSLGYCGEFSESDFLDRESLTKSDGTDVDDLHASDFGVDYSYSIPDIFSIGAGVWYYYFHNESVNSFISGYVSVTADSIPLSPSLTYNHDYYTSDDADEQGKDFYIQFALSHDIDITKELVLNLAGSCGYYNVKSWGSDYAGISDIGLSAGITAAVGSVEISSAFNYVIVPDKDFYKANGRDDINRFYATVGVSYSIL